MKKPAVAIATGDPGGIGPEISLKAALDPRGAVDLPSRRADAVMGAYWKLLEKRSIWMPA